MVGVVPIAVGVVVVAIAYHQYQYNSQMSAVRAANAALNLAGKRAVVVGGTSGIGHGIALRLAQANASVTIVGRSPERGAQIVSEMRRAAGAQSPAHFDFVSCDCFSLASVKDCAGELSRGQTKNKPTPLDYLVMTQGMATLQGFTPTDDGLDQKLTLHVYSRATFAESLLPALKEAEDARVMSVLSAGVHGSYANWKADPDLSKGSYGAKNAADAAGVYNDIVLDSLSRENKDVQFIHACPGFVATNWGTEMPSFVRYLIRAIQIFGRSKEDCAELLVSGLVKPGEEAENNFRLIDQNGKDGPSVASVHDEAREEMWERIHSIVEQGSALEK